MQSMASLMSMDKVVDIGNMDDIDEDDEYEDSLQTRDEISEISNQFQKHFNKDGEA